jgi:hypothetical protein
MLDLAKSLRRIDRDNVSRHVTEIRPRQGLFNLDLRSVWQYRELLYFLIWRDLKVRYKQATIEMAPVFRFKRAGNGLFRMKSRAIGKETTRPGAFLSETRS